jgi:hypothetical protein
MTELILYSLLALVILVLAGWLARNRPPSDEIENQPGGDLSGTSLQASSLDLANRIFDPADYRWLRDELCFPQGASILADHRKELAVKWLKALQNSFKELVRLPEPSPDRADPGSGPSSWQLLWLTLRFQFLLSYALLVVRLFGPYHQLVPRFGLLQTLQNLGGSRSHSDAVSAGHVP